MGRIERDHVPSTEVGDPKIPVSVESQAQGKRQGVLILAQHDGRGRRAGRREIRATVLGDRLGHVVRHPERPVAIEGEGRRVAQSGQHHRRHRGATRRQLSAIESDQGAIVVIGDPQPMSRIEREAGGRTQRASVGRDHRRGSLEAGARQRGGFKRQQTVVVRTGDPHLAAWVERDAKQCLESGARRGERRGRVALPSAAELGRVQAENGGRTRASGPEAFRDRRAGLRVRRRAR